MVTTAMGFAISDPMSLLNTMVDSARIVVSAVISTGRSLVRPAVRIACLFSMPSWRSWFI